MIPLTRDDTTGISTLEQVYSDLSPVLRAYLTRKAGHPEQADGLVRHGGGGNRRHHRDGRRFRRALPTPGGCKMVLQRARHAFARHYREQREASS